MKKKIFNVTIGGYYVVSIVLGIAMALTVAMLACDVWNYAWDRFDDKLEDFLDENPEVLWAATPTMQPSDVVLRRKSMALREQEDCLWNVWIHLPMYRLGNALYYDIGFSSSYRHHIHSYVPLVLVASAIVVVWLSIQIMMGRSANKAWKQKMLQAVGFAMLILLLQLAFQYACLRSAGDVSTVTVLIPVGLLVAPLLVLKKTRQVKPGVTTKETGKTEMAEAVQEAERLADELERETAGV